MDSDYEFFGLTKDKVDLNDLKKSYYNLALLIHPDKSSNINRELANIEMKSINEMYIRLKKDVDLRNKSSEYIKSKDLKNIHKKEVEELDTFNKEMPSFYDIFVETHDNIRKFNDEFEKKRKELDDDTEFLTDFQNNNEGYKLLESEYAKSNNFTIEYNPNFNSNINLNNLGNLDDNKIIPIDKLKSLNIDNFGVDYKEAFMDQEILSKRIPRECYEKFVEEKNINLEFEKKMNERIKELEN